MSKPIEVRVRKIEAPEREVGEDGQIKTSAPLLLVEITRGAYPPTEASMRGQIYRLVPLDNDES